MKYWHEEQPDHEADAHANERHSRFLHREAMTFLKDDGERLKC